MSAPVRTDLGFLRRRVPRTSVEVPEQPSPVRQAPAPAVRSPLRTPTPGLRAKLFPAAAPGRLDELDDETPILRLDALRSSVGSFLVEGAVEVIWESVELVSGSQTVGDQVTGTVVPTPGNRPLVGFEGQPAVVTLRHIRMLRRALFVGEPGRNLGIRLFDGSTITATGPGAGPVVVLLLVIDGLVELRVDSAAEGSSSSDVQAEFGFEVAERFDFHIGDA